MKSLVKTFQNALKSGQLQSLFEYIPGVYFVVKNLEGKVVMANQVAAAACGVRSPDELIGKNDYDLFTKEQADSYVEDDKKVFSTGVPIVDKTELAPDPKHAIHWYVTTKIPLYSHDDNIIGLACIGRNSYHANEILRPFSEMNKVLAYVRANYQKTIRVEDLAKLINLSTSQFQRKFKQVFLITPAQHITNVRIRSACHLLQDTNQTIASIAQEIGYYDHSHFIRSFEKTMSMTPIEYRRSRPRF